MLLTRTYRRVGTHQQLYPSISELIGYNVAVRLYTEDAVVFVDEGHIDYLDYRML